MLIRKMLAATVVILGMALICRLAWSQQQGGYVPGVMQQGMIVNGNATKWWANGVVADGGTFDQISFNQPASGFVAVVPDGIRYYIIGNNALIVAGSLTMPPNPQDSQRVTVSSRSVITAFTMQANAGQTLYGPLTTILAGGFGTWIYRSSDLSWYRIG